MQAERTTPERKFVLTKVATGDYLLPSNDAQTLWRLRSFVDGPSFGIEDWPRDRTFWQLLRWTGDINDAVAIAESIEDGDERDRWEHVEDGFESRSEAIESALRRGVDG